LVLFAYSEVLINEAGLKRLGLTLTSNAARDGSYQFVDGGAIATGNIGARPEPSPKCLQDCGRTQRIPGDARERGGLGN
jgi:hypothetical protein